jgi:tRNA threonylcarbamoyladenosine biosynthesis protein TsaE
MTETPVLRTTRLGSEEQTRAMAEALAPGLSAGDVILLDGPVGAGKSVFARAVISSRLEALGRHEDIPSPTFTLVQVYDLDGVEAWHCDLYRLTDPAEVIELGLDEAFEEAICLVEWPERLGPERPAHAVTLHLEPDAQGAARIATWRGPESWAARLEALNDAA